MKSGSGGVMELLFYSIEMDSFGYWGGDTEYLNYAEIQAGLTYKRRFGKVEFEFDFTPANDFIRCGDDFYLVTPKLEAAMKDAGITGVEFESTKIILTENFLHCNTDLKTPLEYRLVVPSGEMQFSDDQLPIKWSGHDFCLTFYPSNNSSAACSRFSHWLILSEKCYQVLLNFNFKDEYRTEPVLFEEI